jgi:hypothetical protein
LIAICVAYALAMQALMASVGLAMSAATTAGQTDFVICNIAANLNAHAPATDGDRQKPSPQPQCPFCFIAAQSGGQVAAGLRIVDALTERFDPERPRNE